MSVQQSPSSLRIMAARCADLSWAEVRFGAFYISVFLYAAFGSPTPDNPGLAELTIGILLVFATGVDGLRRVFPAWMKSSEKAEEGYWPKPARALLFYGLSLPLAIGVFSGASLISIFRDVLPFLFLLLPLFLSQLSAPHARRLLFAFCVLGFVFALRSLLHLGADVFTSYTGGDALFYLANSPALLTLAILSMALIAQRFPSLSVKNWIVVPALVLVMAVPLMAMGVTLQRASLGLFALAALYALGKMILHRPLQGAVLTAVLALIIVMLWPYMAMTIFALSEKNQSVGSNMRVQELAAVWQAVSAHPLHILFGLGWGAHFQSPAVGMLSVSFTHSLLSATLLKCGLAGLVLLIIYCAEIMRVIIWAFIQAPQMRLFVLALAFPFAVDVVLYAAYKSYDFGLLLLLITLLPRLVDLSRANRGAALR